MEKSAFIWETHGIHVGTGSELIKHGIDDIEGMIKTAVKRNYPSITFIIHTPRLTSFRYKAELDTDMKFIRGDSAYGNYTEKLALLRKKYESLIDIRYGIELEWQGSGLGLQWSRAKLFQAYGVDFVIGSVHFSREKVPYDESGEATLSLIKRRGTLEHFWAKYFNEMVEMVDSCWKMIHVVGHLDLPKLYADLPPVILDSEKSSHYLTRRLSTLLEMISDYNLALDVNIAGLRKGCGTYPALPILKKAGKLGIPITLGTDTHALKEFGTYYKEGIAHALAAGYKTYVSFSRGIPEKRLLEGEQGEHMHLLNVGTEVLNQRFSRTGQRQVPRFSFGGCYRYLASFFPGSPSLGEYQAIRFRKDNYAVTLSDIRPTVYSSNKPGIYFHHTNKPGTLSLLLSILASEGINVETAYIYPLNDGTGEAFLTVSGPVKRLKGALEFALGTDPDRFLRLIPDYTIELPPIPKAKFYLLEVDGVELPIPLAEHMIISIHRNQPGVLFILLAALASRNINILDLRLGKRGEKGYAVLGIDGNIEKLSEITGQLGSQFFEVTHINVPLKKITT